MSRPAPPPPAVGRSDLIEHSEHPKFAQVKSETAHVIGKRADGVTDG